MKAQQSMPKSVVLDTCVMLQSYLLDVLLTAAERGLLQVHWSEVGLQELEEHYVRIRSARHAVEPEEAGRQIQRKIAAMQAAFPEALVSNRTNLEQFVLRDPNDRHVLAAAVQIGADCIVTHNLRDFARTTLAEYGINLQHPDSLLLDLLHQHPGDMLDVIRYIAEKSKRPHVTQGELLAHLERSCPRFVAQARDYTEGSKIM